MIDRSARWMISAVAAWIRQQANAAAVPWSAGQKAAAFQVPQFVWSSVTAVVSHAFAPYSLMPFLRSLLPVLLEQSAIPRTK